MNASPQTFKQLLESCHSLFPDQLVSLLDEMEASHLVRRDGEEYALDGSVPNRWRRFHADWNENLDRAYTSLAAIMERIHLPHCLDYEWWFTHSGRERVAELLLHNNPLPMPESVVFLGSPPYKETWYLFGGELNSDNQNPDEVLISTLKKQTGVDIKTTERLGWDTETKPDHDGNMTFYIYLDYLCEYVSGDLVPAEGIEKLEWVPIEKLSSYNLVPPSRKLFKKIGYL